MTTRTVGRYEIIAELGEGGMATVFLALDPHFEREVAIKVLPREFLHDKTFLARFQREARMVAALEHAAIVPIYDYGEQDGQPFLVLRHMAGGSLARRIGPDAPLPLNETAAILRRVGGALDAAHERGVIHRDVKPANILFDRYGEVFVSDFGIARLIETSSQLTGSGVVGTPGYLAPELAEMGSVTPLIDIYALGVTLFQMLTGEMPYKAETPLGVLMAHMTKPVPDIRRLRPDLPPRAQSVIAQAMAKDPAERYPSAGALADDVQALAAATAAPSRLDRRTPLRPVSREETPPTEQLPSSAPPARPSGSRARPLLWIGAAAALVIAAGLLWRGGGASSPGGAPGSGSPTPISPWTPVVEEFDGVKMVQVPAGCFTMGSQDGAPDEQPAHEVCFDAPFWIDVSEVTNAQFGSAACTEASSEGQQPRVCVTWEEAAAHCARRGARLPTEAEWEYAARGRSSFTYPWGMRFAALNAVFSENSGGMTAIVKSRPGGFSWVGTLDMSGNVWEWVADWYGVYSSEPQIDPVGPASGDYRVARGGSWQDSPDLLRAAVRLRLPPAARDPNVGFRCARAAE